jgi:hypothetical protein
MRLSAMLFNVERSFPLVFLSLNSLDSRLRRCFGQGRTVAEASWNGNVT